MVRRRSDAVCQVLGLLVDPLEVVGVGEGSRLAGLAAGGSGRRSRLGDARTRLPGQLEVEPFLSGKRPQELILCCPSPFSGCCWGDRGFDDPLTASLRGQAVVRGESSTRTGRALLHVGLPNATGEAETEVSGNRQSLLLWVVSLLHGRKDLYRPEVHSRDPEDAGHQCPELECAGAG